MSAWQQLSERFSQLKERERYTALLASVFITAYLLIMQFVLPEFEQWQKLTQQWQQASASIQQQQKVLTELQQQSAVDADAEYLREVEDLQRKEQALQQQIAQLTSYFIGSERMALVLQDVLKSSNKVKISSVTAQPPVPLTFADSGSDNKAVIYQHSTLVVLTGDYFALAEVMAKLDNLKWSLGWQSVDYKVLDYPSAELTLNLLTVSDNESYIKL